MHRLIELCADPEVGKSGESHVGGIGSPEIRLDVIGSRLAASGIPEPGKARLGFS
jgi:hypothetical protein